MSASKSTNPSAKLPTNGHGGDAMTAPPALHQKGGGAQLTQYSTVSAVTLGSSRHLDPHRVDATSAKTVFRPRLSALTPCHGDAPAAAPAGTSNAKQIAASAVTRSNPYLRTPPYAATVRPSTPATHAWEDGSTMNAAALSAELRYPRSGVLQSPPV